MEKKRKIEITIETDRTFLIRARRNMVQVWCAVCQEARGMAPPEEIGALSGMSHRAIYRAVEAGETHFVETIDGSLLVCLKSLGIAEDNAAPAVIKFNSPEGDLLLQLMSQTGEEKIRECLAGADEFQPSVGSALAEPFREREGAGGLPSSKRGWGLTVTSLERLLDFFDEDRERAGQKYESTRRKLIKYFECRGGSSPEEMADEAINRVARRIHEGKKIWASDPSSYFYGVARNILREDWAAPGREFSSIGSLDLKAHPCEDTLKRNDLEYERMMMEKQLEFLEECMQELSPENREMIITYYQGEKGDKIKNRKELARRLNIPPNALRLRVHRIRERLEKQVKDRVDQMQGRRNGF